MKMSKDERCPEEWNKNIVDLGVQRETPGRRRTLVKMSKRKAKNGNISLATAYYTGKNIKVFSKTGGRVPTVLEGGERLHNVST